MKSTTPHVRVSDNARFLMDKDNGFYKRTRTPVERIVFFLSFIGIVALGTSVIIYYDSLTGMYICGSLGIVLFFVGRQVEKIKILLHVSEFMNALFSSVIGKKCKFIAIIKTTGDIVYFNRDFQTLFPEFVAQNTRTLETLLTLGGASAEHIGAVLGGVTGSKETRVNVILHLGESKTAQAFSFNVEPIERPTGFVLLRAE